MACTLPCISLRVCHACTFTSGPPRTRARAIQTCGCQGVRDEGLRKLNRRTVLSSTSLTGFLAAGSPALAREAEREGEVRYSDAEWRGLLMPEQYRVLRQAGTEKRNSSPLVQEHGTGTFRCAGCGADLFSSEAKFESGTGWPSFTAALAGAVELTLDKSIPFMPRTEVRCKRCQGHLGHVFDDGPKPTGLRFCMNGAAMTFVPSSA